MPTLLTPNAWVADNWQQYREIRYAQCWEDADILLQALDIQPHHNCLSIASAGDNTFAMLSRGPERLIAIDLNPAQIACLELRAAAYRELEYPDFMKLLGYVNSPRRMDLYRRCRGLLSTASRQFWDSHHSVIVAGICGAGKFERYLTLFRRYILPMTHNKTSIDKLFRETDAAQRRANYSKYWLTLRWKLCAKLFFSDFLLGRLGRSRDFTRHTCEPVWQCVQRRLEHALATLPPDENPYLQWILLGRFSTALPYALREENYDAIRANIHRLTWHCGTLESLLETVPPATFDRCNLSNIFEYLAPHDYRALLKKLHQSCAPDGRLAYWNLTLRRRRPDELADRIRSRIDLSSPLFKKDKAFFYRDFVVEEMI